MFLIDNTETIIIDDILILKDKDIDIDMIAHDGDKWLSLKDIINHFGKVFIIRSETSLHKWMIEKDKEFFKDKKNIGKEYKKDLSLQNIFKNYSPILVTSVLNPTKSIVILKKEI